MKTKAEWSNLFAARTCSDCGRPDPITDLSFGEDVAGNPTLVIGRTCGCGNGPSVEMLSMRDGGLHIKAAPGTSLTVERIDPPSFEDRRAFERGYRRGLAQTRRELRAIRGERKRSR